MSRWVIVVSLLALWFGGCHRKDANSLSAPVQAVSTNRLRITKEAMPNVTFVAIQTSDFPDVLNLMGKISATEDRTVVVPARVGGRVESVLVTSGELVKPGQPLVTLFSPDFISTREEYLQSIKQAASTAPSDLGNLSLLARKRLAVMGLSTEDIEALKHADITQAESLSTTQATLLVRSPAAGAIVTKNISVGNQVNPGDVMFTIADLRKVWFLGDLYPEDLQKVKRNQDVVIDALPGTPALQGKVSFISPLVDPAARTIKIRALMENTNLSLRADMYVQGKLVLSTRKAMVVPDRAVLREHDSDYVFRKTNAEVDPTNVGGCEVERVKVQLGTENDGLTSVIHGLAEGDQVVSEGALLLSAVLANSNL